MIVECIINTKEELKGHPLYKVLSEQGYGTNLDHYSVAKETYYVVYAIQKNEHGLIFQVIDDLNRIYPLGYYSILFTLKDERVSRYWDNKFQSLSYNEIQRLSTDMEVSFKEWTEDPNFYYKLIEGTAVPNTFTDKEAKEAIKTFQKYKALMDLEFAMPHITEKAIDLGTAHWLMCPKCDESWQDKNASIHEMVKCPKCAKTWLSPLNEKNI